MAGTRKFIAVLALTLGVFVVGAGVAGAQNDNTYVGGETVSRNAPADPQNEVLSATASKSSLAFTGSDALYLGVIGTIALVGGGALLLVRRRTAAA